MTRQPSDPDYQILADAIAAAGGPDSGAVASIRNEIDRNCPDFEWADNWHAQIEGAKAALRTDADKTPVIGPPSADINVRLAALPRAQQFLAEIGDGDLERALAALAFLTAFGRLTGIRDALELWAQLLEAVGGDSVAAQRVVDVITANPDEFPRVVASETARRAA